MKKFLLTAIFILTTASAVTAQERYVKFIDDAPKDKSLVAFRERLLVAIKRRDLPALEKLMDPNIKVSFGGDQGLRDLRRHWKTETKNTRLWDELFTAISNGGILYYPDLSVKRFSAPYSFDGFPEDLDPYSHYLIFGSAVALRETPSLEGNVIARLSYNIVTLDGEKTVTAENVGHSVPEWYFVRTFGGKTGFVNAKFVRSPLDYRVIIEKRRGKWLVSAFVAGD